MAYRIRGTVLPDGDTREVYVVDGRFTFDGVESAETVLDDGVLIPGLVDAHAHLALASPAAPTATIRERVEASAAAHLEAGVLLVREPGGPSRDSQGVGPDGGFPRVITAGRFLAPPDRYFPGLAREVTDEQLPDAAAEELRASGGWVKVIGDTPLAGPGANRTFSTEALHATAARVHELGGRIAIHGMSGEVIDDAIDAGFDSIEHGTSLRPDQTPAMASRGIAWTPTRSIDEALRWMARDMDWPDDAIAELEHDLDEQPAALRAAADAGVTILAGTDAGMGPHGNIRHEVQLLLDAGVGPDVALGAASWTARSFLGLPGIEEGAPADLVAYREDPRSDPSVLAHPILRVLDGAVIT